jgi:quercetin dioxygenase-like cupin family protein
VRLTFEEGFRIQMAGYVLREAEGRSRRWHDYLFTIKASVAEVGNSFAFMEFATEKGQEPAVHTHRDEDEIFYVLEGQLKVQCGDESFAVGPRDFVFLPRDIPHGYEIKSDGLVELLVITLAHSEGANHFAENIEQTGEPISRETVLDYKGRVTS